MVQREGDYCVNDTYLTCVTHLGHILEAGDEVEGYDLTATLADEDFDDHLVKVRIYERCFCAALI